MTNIIPDVAAGNPPNRPCLIRPNALSHPFGITWLRFSCLNDVHHLWSQHHSTTRSDPSCRRHAVPVITYMNRPLYNRALIANYNTRPGFHSVHLFFSGKLRSHVYVPSCEANATSLTVIFGCQMAHPSMLDASLFIGDPV